MKYSTPSLLRLMIPWIIFIPLFAILFHYYMLTQALAPIQLASHTALQYAVQSVARNTANFRRDVTYLASQAASHISPRDPKPCRSSVNQLFQQFAEASDYYLQIRWLDNEGRECLRVELHQNQALLTPPTQLQDKSDRYYVQAGLNLAPGEFYFSKLDLNKEFGVIEQPFVPTLRIVMAVFDHQQNRQGLIVLNARANLILNDLDVVSSNHQLDIHFLNSDGYWLSSPNPSDNWGFMLDQDQLRFGTRFLDAWKVLRDKESGQFINDKGLWSYQTVQPDQDSDRSWKLITHTPQSQIAAMSQWQTLGSVLLGLLLLLLSLWVNLRIVKARQMLQVNNERLTRQKIELKQYADALKNSLEHLESVQTELIETGKLSSLGMMVAGVAHELNTPLGSALVTLSCLDSDTEQLRHAFQHGLKRSDMEHYFKRVREGTELIQRNLKRSAELVKSFKQLAVDRKTEERRKFSLQELINDLKLTAWSGLEKQKSLIDFQIANDIAPLDSYPGALGQVLENLVSNALIHGLKDGSTGQITVSAEQHNEEVYLSVCDNGVGIPEAHREKIFDPFFTTRRGQGGTGLGLHLVHQLVTRVLGGKIQLISAVNQGTCFNLTLPLRSSNSELFSITDVEALP